jgi:CTP:molybdopterin cytidylyltransferase MocA
VKIAGLLLAAGAGHRMGVPKALVRDPDGVSWVVRTTRLLLEAGCAPIVVVIGAAADQVRAELVDEPVELVEATNWSEGMGASLGAGLSALQRLAESPSAPEVVAALVVTVDVPGLTAGVMRRVSTHADRTALARAVYDGTPGHPVLLGRDHWDGVIATAVGDQGARAYLKQHPPVEVECGDLADGSDVDTAEELPDGHWLG